MSGNEGLVALRERLAEKVPILEQLAEVDVGFISAARLRGKAQGMALAISFVDEAIAAALAADAPADEVEACPICGFAPWVDYHDCPGKTARPVPAAPAEPEATEGAEPPAHLTWAEQVGWVYGYDEALRRVAALAPRPAPVSATPTEHVSPGGWRHEGPRPSPGCGPPCREAAERGDPEPPANCAAVLGERPSWMSVDQYAPCRCDLPAGHEPSTDDPSGHSCEHIRSATPTEERS